MPPTSFDARLRAVLATEFARALAVARRDARMELAVRTEWTLTSAWHGTPKSTVVNRPNVFSAWNAPGVKSAVEDAYATFGPPAEDRFVRLGPLGGYSLLDPFQLLDNVIRLAPEAAPEAEAVEIALAAVEEELRATTLRVEYYAPLLGVMVPDGLAVHFPDGVTLRAITTEDANRWHGDPHDRGFMPSSAFVAEVVFPRLLSEKEVIDATTAFPRAVERAKLAMAVLKAGRIGGGRVYTRGVGSIAACGHSILGRSVEFGSYTLTADDAAPLEALALRLQIPPWPALSFAIERLGEAEERRSVRDAILDAVIGLETLLTSGSDREGLRYRFSTHLAALEPHDRPTDRLARFREAYDLYGIRSKIAHTGASAAEYMIAGSKLTAHEVASRAKLLLRSTIHTMMTLDDVPAGNNKRDAYWDRFWPAQVFGLGDASIVDANRSTETAVPEESVG